MNQTLATVLYNRPLASAYGRIGLACGDVFARSRPGQFVMLGFSETRDPLLRRPFSIHRRIHAEGPLGGIELLYKTVGRATQRSTDYHEWNFIVDRIQWEDDQHCIGDGWNGQNSLTFNGTSGQKIYFDAEWRADKGTTDPREYWNVNWLVKVWFKTTDTSGRSLLFIDRKTDDPGTYERFKLYTGTDGKIRFVVYVDFFSSFSPDYMESDINIADGQLHEVDIHLCYRNKYTPSNDAHMWVDGQYAGSLSGTDYSMPTTGNWLQVGHGDVYSGWPGGASRAFAVPTLPPFGV